MQKSTLGIVGHGLMLAPICPYRVAHLENGNLLVGVRPSLKSLNPVAVLSPGNSPAAGGPPTRDKSQSAEHSIFQFGKEGPRIALGNGATELSQVFFHIDSGVDDSPWMLLGPGFWIDPPIGFVATSPAPDDEDDLFEIHLSDNLTKPDAFISFKRHMVSPATLDLTPSAGFRLITKGEIESQSGQVRWVEVEYKNEGEVWRRRYYALPLAIDITLVMNAGAPRTLASKMFTGSDLIARSFAPVVNPEHRSHAWKNTMSDTSEFFASVSDLGVKDALDDWRWLVGASAEPKLLTAMGDLIVSKPVGILRHKAVFLLDTYAGTFKQIASSWDEFKTRIRDGSDESAGWFKVGILTALQKRGLALEAEECYSPVHPPALGGSHEPENFEKTSWRVHLNIMGQIHKQTRNLPAGTRIKSIKIRTP